MGPLLRPYLRVVSHYPNQKLAIFLKRTASAIIYSQQRASFLAKAQPDTINSLRQHLLQH
jgi:hypothetical protein